jgi:hypothetical protein
MFRRAAPLAVLTLLSPPHGSRLKCTPSPAPLACRPSQKATESPPLDVSPTATARLNPTGAGMRPARHPSFSLPICLF